MRFFTVFLAFLVAVVTAQQNAINVPAGQSTLDVTAGQATTITWTNPSSGTVTIKLQQGTSITPTSGIVLGSGIQASTGTFTFTIDASQVNSFQYTIEIIDDTNPSNYNFSPNFGIQGATGTSSASATDSTASITGTSSSSSGTSTATSSGSSSSSSDSSSSSSNSSSSASTSGSSTSSSSASSTRSSATASATTAAPNPNSATVMKASGSLLAFIAGAIALL